MFIVSVALLNENGDRITVVDLPARPFAGDVLYIDGVYYTVDVVVLCHDDDSEFSDEPTVPVQAVVRPRAWTRKPVVLARDL